MRRLLCVAVLLAVPSAALVAPAGAATPRRGPAKAKRLKAFASCSSLAAYGRRYAARPAFVNGVPPRAVPPSPSPLAAPQRRSATTGGPEATAPIAAPLADSGGESFSGTNVQEQGVDEPDLVKTDGTRVFVLAGAKLLAYDVSADTPRLLGSLAIAGAPQQLLLRGAHLLVIGSAQAPGSGGGDVPVGGPVTAVAPPYGGASRTQLTEVNVADPAAMTVSRTLAVDGQFVSGRLTGGTARVVLTTPPDVAEAGRGVGAFIPETTIRSNISRRTFRRRLVGCAAVRRPDAYAGLDLLSVMTIDLDRGLYSVDRDAVLAGAQVVYASPTGLYVASQRYVPSLDSPQDVPPRMTTEIHRFDTSDPERTTYRSTGSVPGFVLNQFALSEDRGALRVATTEEPLWMAGAQQRDSESGVSVLREDGARLVTVGRLGGLGKGERIYAVRFLGDAGYLVTFRQVDPLYTLDLSDPRAPKAAGELKVAGYSAYLHPVGDGLLLGVGQDASAEGVRRGPQVSLFDVSDLAAPRRLQQRLLGDQGASTEAEWDHHAFLWWAPERLAVLPLQQYDTGGPVGPGVPVPLAGAAAVTPFAGAIGLRVERSGIAEAGRVAHGTGAGGAIVRRSLVAKGRLLTVSDQGIAASRLTDLGPLGFTPFPEG